MLFSTVTDGLSLANLDSCISSTEATPCCEESGKDYRGNHTKHVSVSLVNHSCNRMSVFSRYGAEGCRLQEMLTFAHKQITPMEVSKRWHLASRCAFEHFQHLLRCDKHLHRNPFPYPPPTRESTNQRVTLRFKSREWDSYLDISISSWWNTENSPTLSSYCPHISWGLSNQTYETVLNLSPSFSQIPAAKEKEILRNP